MTEPLISVIVTAFNRRQYLGQAVASVVNQDLSRDDFEVVISKNFEDRAVEAQARLAGFHLLECGQETAGVQIAQALDHSHGSVIALLDDDDTWLPSRLRHVAARFRESPKLQYYANTYRPVNSQGSIDYGRARARRAHFARLANGSIEQVDSRNQTIASLDQFFQAYPGNNSSIAVSRRLLEEFLNELRQIRSSIDHFLIIAALLRDEPIVIEHLPLTFWRMHRSNTSGIDTDTFSTFKKNLCETAERIGSDSRVLWQMAVHSGHPALATYLRKKVDVLDELGAILNGDRPLSERVQLASTIAGALPVRPTGDYWSRALLNARVASALSTRFAQVALYIYLQKRISG